MRAMSGRATLHSERAEVTMPSRSASALHFNSRREVLSGAFSTAC